MNIRRFFNKNEQPPMARNPSVLPEEHEEHAEPVKSERLWGFLRDDHPELYKAIQKIVDCVPELRPLALSPHDFCIATDSVANDITLSYSPKTRLWSMKDKTWDVVGPDEDAANALIKSALRREYIHFQETSRALSGKRRYKTVRGHHVFASSLEPKSSANGPAPTRPGTSALVGHDQASVLKY
jgi:hypothetical protein